MVKKLKKAACRFGSAMATMLETDGSGLAWGGCRDGHHPPLLCSLVSLLAHSSGRTAPLKSSANVCCSDRMGSQLFPLTRRKPLSWHPDGFQSYNNKKIIIQFADTFHGWKEQLGEARE